MLNPFLNRRGALAAVGLAAGLTAVPSLSKPRRGKAFDFADSADHLRAYIKMSASEEDGAETRLVYEGVTYGITDGLQMRPLYGMLGFSPVRTFGQPDGSRRILAVEAAVFTDLATGRVLDTWRNPYLDDREVEVWHLRTGPVNFAIDPNKPISVAGWRLLRESEQGIKKFFLPMHVRDDHLVLTVDAQATRKNPVDPALWPAESSGPVLRYSEHNTWRARLADIENPDVPSPEIFAAWHTNKEWRPWMLMGQRPGHIYNHLTAYKVKSISDAPRVLLDYYEKNGPEFLAAPKTWTGGYETDWDHFMKNRKPAAL
jgi:Protein of unknown function (DUF1838)